MRDARVRRWLEALVATPGLTSIRGWEEAWRVHVDDALSALELVDEGPVVDVGSGGGSPGVPLAAALPGLRFVLLEASQRRCAFLRQATRDLDNVAVVCARAEDYARGDGRDAFAVAVTRALAPLPVAVEWCLPLVRAGGRLVLYAGAAGVADEGAAAAAAELGASGPEAVAVTGSQVKRLLVFRKLEPTPQRFPRRTGVARKRPLA